MLLSWLYILIDFKDTYFAVIVARCILWNTENCRNRKTRTYSEFQTEVSSSIYSVPNKPHLRCCYRCRYFTMFYRQMLRSVRAGTDCTAFLQSNTWQIKGNPSYGSFWQIFWDFLLKSSQFCSLNGLREFFYLGKTGHPNFEKTKIFKLDWDWDSFIIHFFSDVWLVRSARYFLGFVPVLRQHASCVFKCFGSLLWQCSYLQGPSLPVYR